MALAIGISSIQEAQLVTTVDKQFESDSDIGDSVMVITMTQFSDSEMNPNEEKFDAQALASLLAQVYSIADWDPPLTTWLIPDPIYNQRVLTFSCLQVCLTKIPLYSTTRTGHNP